MEAGFQLIFLVMKRTLIPTIIIGTLLQSNNLQADNYDMAEIPVDKSVSQRVDREFLELGFFAGLLSIQDFSSEPILGLHVSVYGSEDFFLQFDYASADSSPSSFERNRGLLISTGDRRYEYYDLLVGCNVYSGEVFPRSSTASLSNLYMVAGIGNTKFGGEEKFTYILGVGFKVEVFSEWYWSVDLRNHFYKTSLIQENETTHNVEFSSGLSYVF